MARDQVVRVDELSRHFGDKVAVDRVSFDIARSEVFGFLGPNGAGKTTTIKMLTTLLPPTSGRATVLGRDLKTEGRKIRAQIGVVQQQDSFDQGLNVETSMDIYGLIWNVPKAERRRRIDELIGHFEMEEFRKMPTVDLSAGQRRRLQVAREFIHDMDLLFLDEPTVGLDPIVRRSVLENLKRRFGSAKAVEFKLLQGTSSEMASALSSSPSVSRFGRDEGSGAYRVTTTRPESVIPEIYRLADRLSLTVSSIYISETTLEDAFINLVTEDEKAVANGGRSA